MSFKLSADKVRATTMKLNGRELVLGENHELPDLTGMEAEGAVQLEPATTMAFIVI